MYIIIFLKLFKVYSIKRQLQANLHEWQPPISDHLSRTPKYSQSSLRIRTSFKWPPPVSDNNRVSWLTDLNSDPRWFDSCKMTTSRKRPPSLRILGGCLQKVWQYTQKEIFQVVVILWQILVIFCKCCCNSRIAQLETNEIYRWIGGKRKGWGLKKSKGLSWAKSPVTSDNLQDLSI